MNLAIFLLATLTHTPVTHALASPESLCASLLLEAMQETSEAGLKTARREVMPLLRRAELFAEHDPNAELDDVGNPRTSWWAGVKKSWHAFVEGFRDPGKPRYLQIDNSFRPEDGLSPAEVRAQRSFLKRARASLDSAIRYKGGGLHGVLAVEGAWRIEKTLGRALARDDSALPQASRKSRLADAFDLVRPTSTLSKLLYGFVIGSLLPVTSFQHPDGARLLASIVGSTAMVYLASSEPVLTHVRKLFMRWRERRERRKPISSAASFVARVKQTVVRESASPGMSLVTFDADATVVYERLGELVAGRGGRIQNEAEIRPHLANSFMRTEIYTTHPRSGLSHMLVHVRVVRK